MRQRGRQSAEVLALVPVNGERPRLAAPATLTKEERALFAERAAAAGHLMPTDAPMLASYAQAILLARQLARDGTRAREWAAVVRVQTMLARALRLTAKSRIDPITAGRALRNAAPSYYDKATNDQG